MRSDGQADEHAVERSTSMRLVVSAPGLVPRTRVPSAVADRGTVLVALEHGGERAWLAATLRHHGYRVLTAQHAGHALLMTFRFLRSIDVLVTETMLSEMSGVELSERIRSHCPDLDAVFVSRPLRSDTVVSTINARL